MPFRSNREPAADDWALVRAVQANALLIGPRPALEAALTGLQPHVNPPVSTWEPERLPALNGEGGTVIVRDANTLTDAQQRELLKWLDAHPGRVQVISTSVDPLWPLVERGSFLQSLYYRLNILYIEVAEVSPDI